MSSPEKNGGSEDFPSLSSSLLRALQAFQEVAVAGSNPVAQQEALRTAMGCLLDILGEKVGAICFPTADKSAWEIFGPSSEGVLQMVFCSGDGRKFFNEAVSRPGVSTLTENEGFSLFGGFKSLIACPVRCLDKVLAVVAILTPKERGLSPEDKTLLETVGYSLGSCLQNSKFFSRLQKSELPYGALLENTDEILFQLDKKGCFTSLSGKIFDSIGYRSEELLGCSFQQITHPEDWGITKAAFEDCMEGGSGTTSGFYRVKDRNGSYRWHFSSYTPLRDEIGRIIGGLGIARDVTAELEMQGKLKTSETQLEEIFETIPEAIVVTDTNGKIVDINSVASELLGLKPEESAGQSIYNFINPEDADKIEETRTALLKRGRVSNPEFTLIAKDGTKLPLQMNISLLKDQSAQPLGFLWVGRYLSEVGGSRTELQESEGKLHEQEIRLQESEAELEGLKRKLQESEEQLSESRAKSEKFEERLNGSDSELQEWEVRVQESEAKLGGVKRKLQESAEQLLESRAKSEELEERLKGSDSKLQESEGKLHEQEIRLQESEAELEGLKEKLRHSEKQLSESRAKSGKLETTLQESEARLQGWDVRVEESEAKLQESAEQLSESRARSGELEVKLRESAEQLSESRAKSEKFEERLGESDSKLRESGAKLEEWVVRLQQSEAELEGLKRKLQESEERLSESRARTGESESQLQESEAKLQQWEARLQQSEAELEGLKRKLQESEERLSESRARSGESESQLQESEAKLQQWGLRLQQSEVELEGLKRKLQESEEQLSESRAKSEELEERLEGSESKSCESEAKAREWELRLEASETKLQEGEVRLQQSEAELEGLKRKLQESEERLRESEEKLRESAKQLSESRATSEEFEERLKQSDGKLRESETKSQEREVSLRELKGKLQESEKKSRESEAKSQQAEGKLRQAEGKLWQSEGKVQELEGRLQESEVKSEASQVKLWEWEIKFEELVEKLKESEVKLGDSAEGLEKSEKSVQELREKLQQSQVKLEESEDSLRQTEQKYLNIFNAVPASLILLDARGTVVDVNEWHLNQFEPPGTSREDFLGKDFPSYPPNLKTGLSQKLAELLKGTPFEARNLSLPLGEAGDKRVFDVVGVPRFDLDGEIAGGLLVYLDISQRQELERKAQEARKLVAVRDLASSIAHELSQPIQGLMVLGEMATPGKVEAKHWELVAAITEWLYDLVQGLKHSYLSEGQDQSPPAEKSPD